MKVRSTDFKSLSLKSGTGAWVSNMSLPILAGMPPFHPGRADKAADFTPGQSEPGSQGRMAEAAYKVPFAIVSLICD